ncbi:MFS transporter [Parasediminibacterium sp. JCM 36343]|uniref:MFS transporter n=1 Tax=Parasediminibacterium sp. JCM 36343 TaxID=3374279 RepID=UPI00397A446A
MKPYIRLQLSLMMLLQFFIWGSWYVTMGTYMANTLKADGLQIGAAYGMMAIATIISPFFIGIIADRYFAPKKLLGLLHLAGGLVLLFITKIESANIFNWVLLIYALLYAPTLSLSSSIAFDQLQNTGKSFAGIRVFGTIGWIVAGISIDKVFNLSPSAMGFTFTMAGVASLVLAALSLALPNAQPKDSVVPVSTAAIIGKDAFGLFKKKSFTIFFIASILICIPLSFYYSLANQFLNETGLINATSKMAYGQISETVFIVLIPFFMKRWGIKWMIITGMVAWVLRFLFFRYGDAGNNSWMLIAGIVLHGVCYDFFFVTGQMYTDSISNERNRNAAQGMITMATYGLGMWLGSLISGYVAKQATINASSHHWDTVWLVPAGITVTVLLFFSFLFNENKKQVIVV